MKTVGRASSEAETLGHPKSHFCQFDKRLGVQHIPVPKQSGPQVSASARDLELGLGLD